MPRFGVTRFVAVALALTLAWPPSAYALRTQAGLESPETQRELATALTGLEERTPRRHSASSNTPAFPRLPPGDIRILIAEDDPSHLETLRGVVVDTIRRSSNPLAQQIDVARQVRAVELVSDAIAYLQRERPQLVLTGYLFSGRSYWAEDRRIKALRPILTRWETEAAITSRHNLVGVFSTGLQIGVVAKEVNPESTVIVQTDTSAIGNDIEQMRAFGEPPAMQLTRKDDRTAFSAAVNALLARLALTAGLEEPPAPPAAAVTTMADAAAIARLQSVAVGAWRSAPAALPAGAAGTWLVFDRETAALAPAAIAQGWNVAVIVDDPTVADALERFLRAVPNPHDVLVTVGPRDTLMSVWIGQSPWEDVLDRPGLLRQLGMTSLAEWPATSQAIEHTDRFLAAIGV